MSDAQTDIMYDDLSDKFYEVACNCIAQGFPQVARDLIPAWKKRVPSGNCWRHIEAIEHLLKDYKNTRPDQPVEGRKCNHTADCKKGDYEAGYFCPTCTKDRIEQLQIQLTAAEAELEEEAGKVFTTENVYICKCGRITGDPAEYPDDYGTLGSDSGICCHDCGNENFETIKSHIDRLEAENKKLREIKCPPISDGDTCICPIEELEARIKELKKMISLASAYYENDEYYNMAKVFKQALKEKPK